MEQKERAWRMVKGLNKVISKYLSIGESQFIPMSSGRVLAARILQEQGKHSK